VFAFNNRGAMWFEKGEYAKAIQDFTEAIRLDPQNADTFDMRGQAWEKKGEANKADKDFAEAKRIRERKK
jgi:Tfp pilus assembly protein PilF